MEVGGSIRNYARGVSSASGDVAAIRAGEARKRVANARALAVRPISASSAAACTAVPRISVPDGGAGARERGDAGPPAGWAGCARRSGFGFRAAAALPIGVGGVAGARFGARFVVARGGDAGFDGVRFATFLLTAGVALLGSGGGVGAAAGAGRLLLRRCGRVRGRAPSTSVGGLSLIDHT